MKILKILDHKVCKAGIIFTVEVQKGWFRKTYHIERICRCNFASDSFWVATGESFDTLDSNYLKAMRLYCFSKSSEYND